MMRAPAGRPRRSGRPSSSPTGAARCHIPTFEPASSLVINSLAVHANVSLPCRRGTFQFSSDGCDLMRLVWHPAGCQSHIKLRISSLGQLHAGDSAPTVVAARIHPPHQRPCLLQSHEGSHSKMCRLAVLSAACSAPFCSTGEHLVSMMEPMAACAGLGHPEPEAPGGVCELITACRPSTAAA